MHRISLTNEFLEGPNNVYLFDDEVTTLVDAGYDTPAIRDQLVDGFERADVALESLDRIYITHYHIDHAGLLEWLVDRSGATVFAHPDDIPLLEGDDAAWDAVLQQREAVLREWAVPSSAIRELTDTLIEEDEIYGDVHIEPIGDDVEVDLGETRLRSLHTPGHSLGHLSFAIPAVNEVLTGDALLPEYTPNVGGADLRVDDPLAQYLHTLERLEACRFDRAWPGHRHPIDDPSARAREIIDHHETRAVRVLRALADLGPATPWEISLRLFSDLEGVHILHGPGEAAAHLEHLHRRGAIDRDGSHYQLPPETADRLAAEEPDSWPLTV